MARPIPPEIVEEFRQFCRETLENEWDSGYFTLESFDRFNEVDNDGNPLWEFHAQNYDPPETYDIYELFTLLPEYSIEIHGHDEFWVVPKESQTTNQPMESTMRPPREIMEMDLSQQPGNPTSELQAHAQELWAIQDLQELANAAISIVKPLVGRGMSQRNYQMFLKNMQGAMRRGLTGVQSYITNYILKGSGMGRDQEGGRRPAFGEGVLRILARSDAAVFNEALRSFGLKIVGRINTDPLRTQVRNEDVAALASTITEDAYTPVELSTPAKIAKKIAEEAGYVVAVIEEDDLVEYLSQRDADREMQARRAGKPGPQYGKKAHPDFQPLDSYDEKGNVVPKQDPVPVER